MLFLQICRQAEAEVTSAQIRARARAKVKAADEAVKAKVADEAEAHQDVARAKALVDFLHHQPHTPLHDALAEKSHLCLNPLIPILSVSDVV